MGGKDILKEQHNAKSIMGDFEWALVRALNSFFKKDGIAAIAYRLKQSRFSGQFTDILVDSRIPEYYLAIECKSLDARKTKSLYFKQHFSFAAGAHQMSRETDLSPAPEGRASWRWSFATAPEKRGRRTWFPGGRSSRATRRERRPHPAGDRDQSPPGEKGEAYQISRLDIVRISGYYDLAGEDDELAEEAKEREWKEA